MNLDGLPPVGGLLESSLVHWEGHTAAVVFLQGCNFACPSCPVPHLVPGAGEGGRGRIPVESVLDAVFTRRHLLDGVVIAGGEPLLHDTLPDLCEILRSFGLAVRLRTNGSRPRSLDRLLEANLLDGVSLTLRSPLDGLLSVAAGREVDGRAVFRSVERLVTDGGDHEVRIVIDPRLLTGEDVLRAAATAHGIRRLVLEPLSPGRPGLRVMNGLARDAGRHARSCVVAGRPGRDFGRHGAAPAVGAA